MPPTLAMTITKANIKTAPVIPFPPFLFYHEQDTITAPKMDVSTTAVVMYFAISINHLPNSFLILQIYGKHAAFINFAARNYTNFTLLPAPKDKTTRHKQKSEQSLVQETVCALTQNVPMLPMKRRDAFLKGN